MLKPTEAAVVAGVDLRFVNHAIDRNLLPARLVRVGKNRGVSAEACLYIAFYHASANRLTSEERKFAIHTVDEQLQEANLSEVWKASATQCRVQHDYLQIDLKPFLQLTHARWDQYRSAHAMVTTSPEMLGGTPVIKGTRIPVYDVAASVDAGFSVVRILKAYPSLNADQIELVRIYAKANTPQGRPAGRQMPKGAKLLSEQIVARRLSVS